MDTRPPVSKVTDGENMAVHAVQRIDEGPNQLNQPSWASGQQDRAPVAIDADYNSGAPVNTVQRIEGEDLPHEGGHKGLMDKMKDAGRRLKEKVKGTIGHGGKDTDESESEYLPDPTSKTTPDAAYSQYANVNPAPPYNKGSSESGYGTTPEVAYEGESGAAYGEKSRDLQRPGHFYAAGIPLAADDSFGDGQKGNSGGYSPTPAVGHTQSAPAPSGDFTSTDAVDSSSGGFGAFSRPSGTGPYSSASTYGQGGDAGLERGLDNLNLGKNTAPGAGSGLKDLVGNEKRTGLMPDEAPKQQGDVPTSMGQKVVEGSNIFYGGKNAGDEGISRTDDTELGRGNEPKVVGSERGMPLFAGHDGAAQHRTDVLGVESDNSGIPQGVAKGDSRALGTWRDRLLHVWLAVLNYVTQIWRIFSWRDGAGQAEGGRTLWQDVKDSAVRGQAHGVAKVAPPPSSSDSVAARDSANRSTLQKLKAAAAVTAEKAKVEAGFGAQGTVGSGSVGQPTTHPVAKLPIKQRVKESVTSAAAVVGTAVGSLGAAMGYFGEVGEGDTESEAMSGVTEERKGNDAPLPARGAGGGQTIGSKLASGATTAKDTVMGSTAAAITAASGVTSSIAKKMGYGQHEQVPVYKGTSRDSGPVQNEGMEGVQSQPEGYLGAAARKIGEGKDAVAQRLGYGSQQQTGVVDKGLVVEGEGEVAKPQSEGYLASVTKTLGDGKDAVAQRLGYGGSVQKGEQNVGEGGEGVVLGSDTATQEKSKQRGVVGAVTGTVGAVAGTVGGVKDTVVRSLGYGGNKGGVETGMVGDVKGSSTTSSTGTTTSSGGTWTDSAYGAAGSVADMATKAKDVVAQKVGYGKGTGGQVQGTGMEQGETVPGTGGLPNTMSEQAAVGLANAKEGVMSAAESGKGSVQSALGYGPSGGQTGVHGGEEVVHGGEQQEGKGIIKSVYDTVASTAGSVKGVVATRLGYGGTGSDTVPSETMPMESTVPDQGFVKEVKRTITPATEGPTSGFNKARGEIADLKQAEKAAAYTNPNAEAAKYVVDEVRETYNRQ